MGDGARRYRFKNGAVDRSLIKSKR